MGGEVQLSIPKSLEKTFFYDVSIKIATLSPNHQILIENNGRNYVVTINGLTKILSWRVSSEQTIRISSKSPCISPSSVGMGTDPRELCFGITTTNVIPVQFPESSSQSLFEK
jgi:hypothetical protein